MSENVRNKVKELLGTGKISGFLGLSNKYGHIGPHLFTDENVLDHLVVGDWEQPGDTRYSINKQLIHIASKYPEEVFGVLVRGCDERGLKNLFTWNQLKQEKVVPVGVACPPMLAAYCECRKPFPDEFVEGEKTEGVEALSVAKVDHLDLPERFNYWKDVFSRCIKCYGCRDVCPMCFCKECALEDNNLVATGEIPPEIPVFHLTRAIHMVGRCIDCGLCNEACPADIPLRTLYKKVADIIDDQFQYRPGFTDGKSPLNMLGAGTEG
jgi:formate dehydrogenase subunit beta